MLEYDIYNGYLSHIDKNFVIRMYNRKRIGL